MDVDEYRKWAHVGLHLYISLFVFPFSVIRMSKAEAQLRACMGLYFFYRKLQYTTVIR